MAWTEAQEVEKGKNFDRVLLNIDEDGTKTYKWTSNPERVLSDSWTWENFIFTNSTDSLLFESKRVTFEFDKNSCSFKLYEAGRKGTKQPVIDSFSHSIKIDNTAKALSCDTSSVVTDDGIRLTVDRGIFNIVYDLRYHGGVEWTFDFLNNEGKKALVTITDTCNNCQAKRTQNTITNSTLIYFDSYFLDTKNDVHTTLKDHFDDNGNYIINYERSVEDKKRLIIDPLFSSDDPSLDGLIYTDAHTSSTCSTASLTKSTTGARINMIRDDADLSGRCYNGFVEWDTSTIPDGAVINDVVFKYEVDNTAGDLSLFEHGAYPMIESVTNMDCSGASASTIWSDSIDGTRYSILTESISTDNSADLGVNADTDLKDNLVNDKFCIGTSTGSDSRSSTDAYRVDIESEDGSPTPPPTLEVTYNEPIGANAPNDLTSPEQSFTSVELDWTTPELNDAEEITGYQIKFTTPHSLSVNSIVTNDTQSTVTEYTVSNLDISTDYSFRVGTWSLNATSGEGFFNGTGNILNTTTLGTVGNFTQNYTNPDIIDIRFEEIEVNDTTTRLNVTYPNTFTYFNCRFNYDISVAETEHNNVSSLSIDNDFNETSFLFVNATYDTIRAYCWDLATNNSATYILSLGNIPLVTHLKNFQSGVYGTSGQFGAVDLVTLGILIVTMIGFNRVNETVGAIFSFMLIGALAWFDIIAFPTIVFGGIAVVLMLVITSTKKD